MSASRAINLGKLSDNPRDEEIGAGIFFIYLQPILQFFRTPTGKSRALLDKPETLQGGWSFTDPSGHLLSPCISIGQRTRIKR